MKHHERLDARHAQAYQAGKHDTIDSVYPALVHLNPARKPYRPERQPEMKHQKNQTPGTRERTKQAK